MSTLNEKRNKRIFLAGVEKYSYHLTKEEKIKEAINGIEIFDSVILKEFLKSLKKAEENILLDDIKAIKRMFYRFN